MVAFLLRVAALTGVYLLVLTSLQLGDVLIGLVVSTVVASVTRTASPPSGPPLLRRLAAAPGLAASVCADVVRGTWRVVRCCLGNPDSATAGLVTVPVAERSAAGLAASGLLAGLAADELIVDIDMEQGVMLVHVLDASDPEAVRARHRTFYERQRRVVP